jgi:hypothetical protein
MDLMFLAHTSIFYVLYGAGVFINFLCVHFVVIISEPQHRILQPSDFKVQTPLGQTREYAGQVEEL